MNYSERSKPPQRSSPPSSAAAAVASLRLLSPPHPVLHLRAHLLLQSAE